MCVFPSQQLSEKCDILNFKGYYFNNMTAMRQIQNGLVSKGIYYILLGDNYIRLYLNKSGIVKYISSSIDSYTSALSACDNFRNLLNEHTGTIMNA